MKRLFLTLLTALLFLISCSDDVSVNQESQSFVLKDTKDLTPLYLEMINSSEYALLYQANELMINRLGITGKGLVFKTPEELKGWVMSNISSTTYSNYNQFLVDWNDCVSKQEITYNKYKLFFIELHANPDAEVNLPNETQGEDCCDQAYNLCAGAAAARYMGECAGLAANDAADVPYQNYDLAQMNYTGAMLDCKYERIDCVNLGCG